MNTLRLTVLLFLVTATLFAADSGDPVASRYAPDLARIKQDYERQVGDVYKRMIHDYEGQIKFTVSTTKVDEVERAKARIQSLHDRLVPSDAIIGKWAIIQSDKTMAIWTFNRDGTYNYWNATGKWTFRDGKFSLAHTWDWQITLTSEDTFEGTCTRGADCSIRGLRLPDDYLVEEHPIKSQ